LLVFLIPKLNKKDSRCTLICEREPRISFALCCGAYSSPAVVVYQPETVNEQIESNTRLFLETWVKLEPEKQRVELPQVLEWYKTDFCASGSTLAENSQILSYVTKRVADRETLNLFSQFSEESGKAMVEVKVEYTPFAWNFYYFSEKGRYDGVKRKYTTLTTASADDLLKTKLNAARVSAHNLQPTKKPEPQPDDAVCDPKTMRGGNAGTGAALIVD